ncbi:Transcriptional regulator, contains XRE-family HTH domain [Lentzea fradiae]|uniref:Transcriptional regulator, contains XRE-family HTH domain n=1 Tax=Lentzea fradiae TaxID=200378 RepID=A0A1G7XU72_9PSEU|nr:XRE family transcriptional regulator [Lentzea fradiae]SDG87573.1 Transcriptional regulator, contains XRE-family HTH domain [Lentzea fradiae]
MFTPSRLTLARSLRGLSAAELARKAGVQARAVSEYERGVRRPKPVTVEALAGALGFPEAFLRAPEPPRPQHVPAQAPPTSQAAAAAQLAIEFNGWLERLFVLPQPNLPPPRTSPDDTRSRWRLDHSPAPNMVQLLESHGVRVFSLPVDCTAQEAFSCWHDGTPYVFLTPTATPEQARFDAAVQLAVLLGHGRPQEFAAEFLMPRQRLKGTDHRHWHVARDKFVQRANVLSLAHGGMTRRETSKLLTKVFKVLRENGTTPLHVAKELHLGLEELNGLVFGLVLTALPGGGEQGPKSRAHLTLVH